MRSLPIPFVAVLENVKRPSQSKDHSASLHTAALWAAQWVFQFRWSKCRTMQFERGQALNLAAEDELWRHDIEPVNAFKDLGVVLSPELKHHDQVDAVVKKARNAALLI